MDQYLEQLWDLLLEAYLERGGELMHLVQRKIVSHRDVTGKVQPLVELSYDHLVHIHHVWESGGYFPQTRQHLFAGCEFVTGLDRGRFAFNVRQDRGYLRHIALD